MKNIFCVLVILCSCFVFGQKLETSKKELNANSGNNSQTTTSESGKNNTDQPDNPLLGFLFDITFGLMKLGFVGDYRTENHLDNNVTPYPFYNSKSGNFEPQDSVFKTSFRIDLEDHFIYNHSDLYGNHLKAKIRPFQYFYFQTDYRQLYEFRLDHTTDNLSLLHFNFVYDRIRFEKFNFGWTLGASYVGNNVKKAGFNYGLTADYFMTNNFSFSAAAKWSQINSQPVNAFEFQAKRHVKNYFFALGFQRLKIASPTYNFVTLGGGIYF